jgi:MFS family permease
MKPGLALGISVVWIPLAFLFDGLTALVLPVRLVAEDGPSTATVIGLVTFVGIGLGIAVQLLAGTISDRLRRRVDRRLFITLAALPVVAGLWLIGRAGDVPGVALGYLIVQAAAAAIQAAQQSLIPEHVGARAHGRAAGLKTAADIGGAFVAFATLGWLLEAGGPFAWPLAVTVVLAAAIGFLWMFVPRSSQRTHLGPEPLTALPPGFARLIVSRFLFLLGIYAIGRFLLLLVADRLAIPAEAAAQETGGLLAVFTLVTAAGALVCGPLVDRLGRSRLMGLGTIVATIGIVAFIPAFGLAGVLVAGILMSLGTSAFAAANWAALTDLAAPESAGRLMAVANLGTAGAAACAGLVGPLIDAAGFSPALVLAALATIAALVPVVRAAPAAVLEKAS